MIHEASGEAVRFELPEGGWADAGGAVPNADCSTQGGSPRGESPRGAPRAAVALLLPVVLSEGDEEAEEGDDGYEVGEGIDEAGVAVNEYEDGGEAVETEGAAQLSAAPFGAAPFDATEAGGYGAGVGGFSGAYAGSFHAAVPYPAAAEQEEDEAPPPAADDIHDDDDEDDDAAPPTDPLLPPLLALSEQQAQLMQHRPPLPPDDEDAGLFAPPQETIGRVGIRAFGEEERARVRALGLARAAAGARRAHAAAIAAAAARARGEPGEPQTAPQQQRQQRQQQQPQHQQDEQQQRPQLLHQRQQQWRPGQAVEYSVTVRGRGPRGQGRDASQHEALSGGAAGDPADDVSIAVVGTLGDTGPLQLAGARRGAREGGGVAGGGAETFYVQVGARAGAPLAG